MSKSVSPAGNLIQAIRSGRLSSVIAALDEGADIEEADMHGARGLPLRVACFEGNLGIVRELLVRGANPNAPASDGPGAPLRLALRRNHRDVIAVLLKNGTAIPEGTHIDPEILAATQIDLGELADALAPGELSEAEDMAVTDVSAGIADGEEENFGTATRAISADLMFIEERELTLEAIQPSSRKNRPDPLA